MVSGVVGWQSPTGGRIAVIQTQLPTVGTGALKSREEPDERLGKVCVGHVFYDICLWYVIRWHLFLMPVLLLL